MPITPNQPLHIFLAYTQEDRSYRDALLKHLSLFQKQKEIDVWDDMRLLAGVNQQREINKQINQADIAIFLISSDFLASDKFDTIAAQIDQRAQQQQLVRVPILIRPVYESPSAIFPLQGIPKNGQSISLWANQDEAWVHIVRELTQVFKEVRRNKQSPINNLSSSTQTAPSSQVTKQDIKQWVADNNMKAVFKHLDQLSRGNKNWENEYLLIKARFNQLEKNSRLGIISPDHQLLERNKIYYSLLALIDRL